MWVLDLATKSFVSRNVTTVPGLFKIFDEILVNAADNKQRDASMDRLDVTINPETNTIRVWNNGAGIPVVMHKEHNIYVPELIFGHLLTSSNYDDDEKKGMHVLLAVHASRACVEHGTHALEVPLVSFAASRAVTGGRNGYGAKLANIFSTEFTVETFDSSRGLKYRQVFRNNMSDKGDAVITSSSGKSDYTCITFKPDLARFHMTHLDDDIVALMMKRVYDIAGVTDKSLRVTLNDEPLAIRSFKDYVSRYIVRVHTSAGIRHALTQCDCLFTPAFLT